MTKSSTAKLLLQNLPKTNSWQNGPYPKQLEEQIEKMFETDVRVVNSGRSAIYLALKALKIGQGDEVLLQAYTCNAVPNPILWSGATPIYVDIDPETLNLDTQDLRKKITPRTKAIIVQHTFGRSAKIREILKIADAHQLRVIEDCAHSLGAKSDGKFLGTFGDLAILSFGREKVISSLTGGALLINDKSLTTVIDEELKLLKPLTKGRIFQELLNYFSWRVLFRRIYTKNWGINFVKHLYQYDFVNVVTSQKELSGLNPGWYPTLMPNLFAQVALSEFEKIGSYNERRQEIALHYSQKLTNPGFTLLSSHDGVYLRIIALHPKAHLVLEKAKELKLNFGNWYNSVIYPESVHLSKLGYASGSCPNAEKTALQTLNLPNYIGMTEIEVERVIDFLNKYN